MTDKQQKQVELLVRHMGAVGRSDHAAAKKIRDEAKQHGFEVTVMDSNKEKEAQQ